MMTTETALTPGWNSHLYQNQFAFVWQYGESLIDLLAPQAGEAILDLGCGTGQLTAKLANTGARVVGMDSSAEMIRMARQNYPDLIFEQADAQNFQFSQSFDAVFSNATLHWIQNPDAVIACIHRVLQPGGRFVAEFGGKGNIHHIVDALRNALTTIDSAPQPVTTPWYFPGISEYTARLEQQGFEVTYATLFDRPTPQAPGEAGLENWLKMFAGYFFRGLTDQQQTEVIRSVETRLRPVLYREGSWTVDYRRIRVMAIRL